VEEVKGGFLLLALLDACTGGSKGNTGTTHDNGDTGKH